MELITVEDLAAYLGQDIEGRLPQAVEAVDTANAVCAAEAGWNFDDGTDHTVTVRVTGPLLDVGHVMVTRLVSVTIDGKPRKADLIRGKVWLRINPWELAPDLRAVVTFRCGWSGDALEQARGIAKRVAARRFLNPVGLTNYTNTAYNTQLPDMSGRLLTPDEQRMLGRIGGNSAVMT